MLRDQDFNGVNGTATLSTSEDGHTDLAVHTRTGYMYTIFNNNAETRKMQRLALARMEKEARGKD